LPRSPGGGCGAPPGRIAVLPGCRPADGITGTGKRLGPDHVWVPRVGRKDVMPGVLAPDHVPVDTDARHCLLLASRHVRGR